MAEDFPRNALFVTSANGYELARYEYPSRADAAPAHSPSNFSAVRTLSIRCSVAQLNDLRASNCVTTPSSPNSAKMT
jgi:hypothetical protein